MLSNEPVEIRTAVVPAAGLGTRFLPASKAIPKPLATVVDRPAVQWVVEEAVAAGLTRIALVIGPGQEVIAEHFGHHAELEAVLDAKGKTELADDMRRIADMAEIHVIIQEEPLGLGHAVACGRAVTGDERFAVLLADDLMHPQSPVLREMVQRASDEDTSVIACMRVDARQISLYGCVELAEDGEHVIDVVEKPKPEEAKSDLAVIGRYVFTPGIYDALDRIEPAKGGELQLTDAITLLGREEGVLAHIFEEGRFDIGNHLDYLSSTVQLALDHPTLGKPFAEALERIVADR